jgi:hypothetical protein
MKLKIPTTIEITEGYPYGYSNHNFQILLNFLVNNTTIMSSTAPTIHHASFAPQYVDFFHKSQLKGGMNIEVKSITIVRYSDINKRIAVQFNWENSSAVVIAHID